MGVTWFLFFFWAYLVMFMGFVKYYGVLNHSDKIMGVTWFLFSFGGFEIIYGGFYYVIYGCRT